jgi:hypothetical protein
MPMTEGVLKKIWITSFCFVVAMTFFSLSHPFFLLGDSLSDSSAVSAPKASKKKKKKHKKIKQGKLKVTKNSAGSQDEISDQTDVSQQADQPGNKKGR